MRILLTNDDGFDAEGLAVLRAIAEELTDDVWSVAPERNQSGAGHSLTLHEPLRRRTLDDERSFALSGTPTDCVIMGVRHVLKDNPPDLVLSGINRGQNIADDVMYSGTIAGAREATMMGIPSIALSQAFAYNDRGLPKWETGRELAPDLIRKLLKQREISPESWPRDVLMNINFPDHTAADVEGTVVTKQGRRDQNLIYMDERHDTWGRAYYWFNFERKKSTPPEGTDLWAVHNGYVSVTPLQLDMSNAASSKLLRDIF